ncbi:UDP-N-acetylmuramoyl-tripeptide--D-alanyl-D-alanine ligase [Bacteroidia bacterium]|nr:UDP-N-acetylmuramoyl-tripeptide--D-alanyl-D-alanine ligase [Bacteroidia bacterium]MDC0104607.1 UDP-N-acetylmuramoyl-tripeptide--D-alanyl-D-alanine ligase [Bacteroidia bacterium]
MQVSEFYNHFIKANFNFITDSRKISSGCVFFALKGDNFNGNSFAIKALEQGASYAVVDENVGTDKRLILVDDVLTYMQELAHFHRKCFDIPVVGICGSNGKTTTKNLIYRVLAKKYKTHCTQGNFNNHIGVPITLLEMPQDAEVAIIELGTNSPGEIAELCSITNPNYGLITNIGKEHLEGFGTLEAVAKEESEIYHYLLKNKGTAFVNADDDWLSRMSRGLENKILFTKADCKIETLVPTIQFSYKNVSFTSSLMGDYNLDNILTAIAIGEHLRVDLQYIRDGIAEYQPDNNRSQLIQKGTNTILLDAYNANPSSMQVAISNFAKMPQIQKVLILGDMFEMGPTANQEHDELLQWCTQFGFTKIYTLGDHFAAISVNSDISTPSSMEKLGEEIKTVDYQNTAFLIKGSRGMKMERVVDYI